jgi:DNA topoisomerase-3
MPSHEAMEIAEKLYNKGYISYPRTETQRYSQSENLKKYVTIQIDNPFWGDHANKLLNENRFQYPKKGPLDDKSHPPIHPVKYPPMNNLTDKEIKVYELITRHFLASVSPDAKAEETIIEVEIAEEEFSAKGITILDLGYLEVFKYDKWEGSILPKMNVNDNISPEIKLNSGKTSAPPYLSEADLITLMDKNGIGTDATIHEHIKTVQERGYAFLMGGYFKPSLIGTTLVRMYEHIGIDLYKPYLRANMEREIKEVCDGNKVKVKRL